MCTQEVKLNKINYLYFFTAGLITLGIKHRSRALHSLEMAGRRFWVGYKRKTEESGIMCQVNEARVMQEVVLVVATDTLASHQLLTPKTTVPTQQIQNNNILQL